MFIGATALTNNNVYKIILVGYLGLLFFWIQSISNEFLFFDVDNHICCIFSYEPPDDQVLYYTQKGFHLCLNWEIKIKIMKIKS